MTAIGRQVRATAVMLAVAGLALLLSLSGDQGMTTWDYLLGIFLGFLSGYLCRATEHE